MIKKIIPYLMTAVLLFSVGCAKTGDLEDLENQLKELEGRLEQSEAALQASLLDQIGDLQVVIASLQDALDANDAAQSAALAAQMAELEALATLVEENGDANAIYYGNVISADQFDAVLAQGASVVTGDVVVTAEMIDKLVNVKLIGGDLNVNSELTLASLEVVVGTMTVNEMVTASTLTSAGNLTLNASIDAPELTAVTGDVYSYKNENFTKFMAPKLGFANSISIEGVVTYSMIGSVSYSMTDFKVADGITVVQDFMLTSVISKSDLVIGTVSGNLFISQGVFEKISYTGESVGDFLVSDIYTLVSITAENLITANSITINSNYENFSDPIVQHGLYLMNFDKVETVSGSLKISGNNSLQEFDTFNVLTFVGGEFKVNDGGANCTKFNAFNELITIGDPSDDNSPYWDTEVRIKSSNITAFGKILNVNNLTQLTVISGDDVAIFANLETIAGELDIDFTMVAGTVNSLSNFKHFTRYNPTLIIRMPRNQVDIAAHINNNADVYKPFCGFIQNLTHTLSGDMKTVTSKFSHLQNGITQRTNYGTFELYKGYSKSAPYNLDKSSWPYTFIEGEADPYWTEAIDGITSACN